MKQETLEEAAETYADFSNDYVPLEFGENNFNETTKRNFIEGAKWQAERMYSEEDLKKAFQDGQDNMDYSEMYGWSSKLTEQEWFEQFKKK